MYDFMRKIIFAIILLLLACSLCQASTLYRVRFAYYPDKIRAVFDFDGAFSYQTQESEKEIVLFLKRAQASYQIENYVELNDLIIRYFEIEKTEYGLKVTIPLAEEIEYKIFHLNSPPRLVIDFKRDFLNIVSGGSVADGIEYLKVKKGSAKGNLAASVLKIDLDQVTVEPTLAKKYKPNILQSFVDLINPWRRVDFAQKHFFLDSVKNMASQIEALAAINGTFYASSGSPLGALIIHGELVSYPIYDRTALIIDEKNRAYIDNVFMSSSFRVKNGIRYKITGINQSRGTNDSIIYTSAWGKRTETNSQGIELVIAKSRIKNINLSNSEIPPNGYVLSLSGPKVETLLQNVNVGDKIKTQFKTVTYNTSPGRIVHLVSGGPRLLKNGRIYVSKHEERFRPDVAKRRAARTAVGITKTGKLLLVTVKRPQKAKGSGASSGATLEELSNLMLTLGAVEAVNLDGGGSTTMIVRGRTVCGSYRRVSNAIVVREKNL